MPTNPVRLIDTSVLLNLLDVPGRSDRASEAKAEYRAALARSTKFVLPITAIIETGNLISQCEGDRRGAAKRFCRAIEAAKDNNPPWTIRGVNWDAAFLDSLLRGASTGSGLVEHLANRTLGAGDIAILVERDNFLRETAFTEVDIWSYDTGLAAHATP